MKHIDTAVVIIDEQRGFMPASEGERLALSGFGELGVPGGEDTVAPINHLLGAAAAAGALIATTQDWHPYETAHFAPEGESPNFTTTWPRHCVDGTPGAELHPELLVPHTRVRFIKGMEHLEHGEDDLSYSGYYAIDPVTNLSLPEWLQQNKVREVVLGGLALDYCVGKSALDLREKSGLTVKVALDATRPVAPETGEHMIAHLQRAGVQLTTTSDVIAGLQTAA